MNTAIPASSPSSTASTLPSARLATQPARPSACAAVTAEARKATPCTRPVMRSRLRTRILFIQPERIEAHDVVDAKVVVRIVALDVVEPAVINLLPGHRQQGRVLFKDRLGLSDQVLAPGLVELAVNLRQEFLERWVVPFRVVLGASLAIPGPEVIGWVDQRGLLNIDGDVEGAPLRFAEPYRSLDSTQVRLDADGLEHLLHRWGPGVERRRIPDQEVHSFEALGMP